MEDKYFNIPTVIINLFFIGFLLYVITVVPIDGLVLEPINTQNQLLNICIWYVLLMFCINELFIASNRLVKKEKKDGRK